MAARRFATFFNISNVDSAPFRLDTTARCYGWIAQLSCMGSLVRRCSLCMSVACGGGQMPLLAQNLR